MRLRPALLAVLAVGWGVAAWLLWPRSVPSLHMPHVAASSYFTAHQLRAATSYSRLERIDWLLATLAQLGALAWYARNGRRWLRESAAGRMGTGMLLGMLGFALVWAVQVPFTVVELWWERKHSLTHVGYVDVVLGNWLALGSQFTLLCIALAIVMGLARRVGELWWIPAVPVFVALATLSAYVAPWLLNTHPLGNDRLRAAATRLEKIEHVPRTPIVVEPVRSVTTLPNAEATGFGASRRVVLWNTLLDGRFTDREVTIVLAHEIGHLNHDDIWRGVGWYALLTIPEAFLIARITRRRGGMGQPRAVPLALLVLVGFGVATRPIDNVFSRRIEMSADWAALQATKDPVGATGLFKRFVPTTLGQPNPPAWDYVMLENHPTIMQRIALVQAWRSYAASEAQSP